MPGAPNVEEVEQPGGRRTLSPTKEWSAQISGTPKGDAMHAFYMLMQVLSVPAYVILTIAAVKFADDTKSIDYVEWINNRSNWPEEDKQGCLQVFKTVEENLKKRGIGLETPATETKKSLEDDWTVN